MRFAYWPGQSGGGQALTIAITIVLFLVGLAVLR